MDESTQAVEQVSRIMYNGAEVVIRASGDGIKNLAAIIAVALKEESKSSGAMHLKTMLKSGKELTVFHLPKELLKDFAKEVKRYGITYCIIKDKSTGKDGQLELLVKSEDAPKISRVMDRLNYAGIDMEDMDATLDDINAEAGRDGGESQDPPETEQSSEKQQDKQPEGTPKDAPPKEKTEEEMKPENPTTARPGNDLPFAPGYQKLEASEEISMNETSDPRGRKSVRKEIEEIRNDLKDRRDKKKKQRTREVPDDILYRNLEEQRRREEVLRGGGR